MFDFKVSPIGRDITRVVRTSLRAPQYGHPVHRERAQGTGPCRECLSPFQVGSDDRLLFTYNPFGDTAVTPQPGPVFIHADECHSYVGTGYPGGLVEVPILVEAHHRDGSRSVAHRLLRGEESATLSELLQNEDVRTLHLRHADAGCFIARVDRAEPASTDERNVGTGRV